MSGAPACLLAKPLSFSNITEDFQGGKRARILPSDCSLTIFVFLDCAITLLPLWPSETAVHSLSCFFPNGEYSHDLHFPELLT